MIVKKSTHKKAVQTAEPQILTVRNPDGWGIPDESCDASAAMKLSVVYACVNYLCDFVASLPAYVWDGTGRRRIGEHPLNYLLSTRPNPYQSPSTFKRYMQRCLSLRGNAYAYISRDPQTCTPRELLPLDPDHMRVDLQNSDIIYTYTMPRTGVTYLLDAQDILHFVGDSDNGYLGVSPLQYAARTLSRATVAEQYETAVYANNARPGGVLQTEADLGGMSEVEDPKNPGKFISRKENVRRAWERAHGGGSNAFRVAVLDNGLKYEPIKIDAFDASFVSAKDLSIADISRFFGVPLHCLGTGKQSYSSNEQNSLEFVQGRGLAIIRAQEEELSYKLLLDSELAKDYRIKLNLEGRLRGDSAARSSYYKNMHEIGAYSVNDILRLEDMPDTQGGDVHYASLNYVPLADFAELSRRRNNPDGGS